MRKKQPVEFFNKLIGNKAKEYGRKEQHTAVRE